MKILYSFNKTGFELDYWNKELSFKSEDIEYIPFNHGVYLNPMNYIRAQLLDDLYYKKNNDLIKLYQDIKENSIKHIDYMSIDVEGHELNVIKGIDFDAVRINVLSIENCSLPNSVYGDDSIRKIMIDNNYILWGRIVGLDDIYVHNSYVKIKGE